MNDLFYFLLKEAVTAGMSVVLNTYDMPVLNLLRKNRLMGETDRCALLSTSFCQYSYLILSPQYEIGSRIFLDIAIPVIDNSYQNAACKKLQW